MTTFEAATRDTAGESHARTALRAAPAAVEAEWQGVAAPGYVGVWRHVKRAVDVVGASIGVVATAPLLLLVALAVAATSPGRPVYGQRRIGRTGKEFRCWKFRTMYRDAEERLRADPVLWRRYVDNDFKLESHDDPRVTPVGRFLRRTSLDELPQLFNVLLGSMSLVGPRPVVAEELECYGPWAEAYLIAKPGITGVWQCGGRNQIRYPRRAQLDAEYVQAWTLWGDLKILLRTVPAVVRRDGVD